MTELTDEEKFIIEKLKEKGGTLNYKELQILCGDQFEGVRLILKKLKEKGIVDYEGMIPGFSAEIKLIKDLEI
jgi:transcription initiation factor IIE alpha subunit